MTSFLEIVNLARALLETHGRISLRVLRRVLCEEGAESLECYVIAEGEAEVVVGGDVVRRVAVNDVVAEVGPLTGNARSATVRATSHMLTFAISKDRLHHLAESSPRAREGMFAYMKERYAQ